MLCITLRAVTTDYTDFEGLVEHIKSNLDSATGPLHILVDCSRVIVENSVPLAWLSSLARLGESVEHVYLFMPNTAFTQYARRISLSFSVPPGRRT